MPSPGRRVRKLKICGSTEDVINASLIALQDAFNMASFPGLPPNRLLFIKCLDLGEIQQGLSHVVLSKIIDSKVQDISYQMVCADIEEQPAGSAVWFSDNIQPVFSLIEIYMKNKQPSAWYWPLVFPSWHSGMGFTQVYNLILTDVIDVELKALVSAQIIQKLFYNSRENEIFPALTPELATRLLNEVGIFPQEVSVLLYEEHSPAVYPDIHKDWVALIQESISNLGAQAPQTLWLSYNALFTHNPAAVQSGDGVLKQISGLIKNLIPVQKTEKDKIRQSFDQQDKNSAEFNVLDKNNLDDSLEIEMVINRKLGKEIKNNQEVIVAYSKEVNDYIEDGALTDKSDQLGIFHEGENRAVVDADKLTDESSVRKLNRKQLTKFYTPVNGFVLTRNTGFVFVVPLLEFVAIRDILSLNTALAELNLPARVITAVARRFNISQAHPLLLSLSELPDVPDKALHRFRSPESWGALIDTAHSNKKSLFCFYTDKDRKSCYITDKTKNLVLYVGTSNQFEFPQWINKLEIIEKIGVYKFPCLNDLENTLQLLFSRYLFRHAKLGLRNLIKREGAMAITKTHIDILFDGREIDPRIRIAGLDINLGWVSWLAMVVQFHYESKGYNDV